MSEDLKQAAESGAPATGAAAKNNKKTAKPGKSPSLINATQSALLHSRLKEIEAAHGKKLLHTSDNPRNDGCSRMTETLAAAVESGRLQLKSGADLTAAVAGIFREGEAEFAMLSKVKHAIALGKIYSLDFAELLADRDASRILEKEFTLQQEADDLKEDMVGKEIVRAAGKIKRAIATGTNTGVEVTAMLDEFEQMTFGGGE